MSKLNPGDRFRIKHKPEVEGTIVEVNEIGVYIRTDTIIEAIDDEGKDVRVNEGYIPHQYAEEILEITEKSDWASIWDDNSN